MAAPQHDEQPDPNAGSERPELTDQEREILELERTWWKYAGAKESEIRKRFEISTTRYYQVLNALLERREALEFDPMLVRRLRRLRQDRARSRSAERLGIDV